MKYLLTIIAILALSLPVDAQQTERRGGPPRRNGPPGNQDAIGRGPGDRGPRGNNGNQNPGRPGQGNPGNPNRPAPGAPGQPGLPGSPVGYTDLGVVPGYGSVWLGQVWRPNAWVTEWNPVVVPPDAVQPIPVPLAGDVEEREISFWHNGVKYVLE